MHAKNLTPTFYNLIVVEHKKACYLSLLLVKKNIEIDRKLYSLIVFICNGTDWQMQIDHLHGSTLHHTLYLNWKEKKKKKCFSAKICPITSTQF